MEPHKSDTRLLRHLAAIADARIPYNLFRRWGTIGFGFGSGGVEEQAGVALVVEARGEKR